MTVYSNGPGIFMSVFLKMDLYAMAHHFRKKCFVLICIQYALLKTLLLRLVASWRMAITYPSLETPGHF